MGNITGKNWVLWKFVLSVAYIGFMMDIKNEKHNNETTKKDNNLHSATEFIIPINGGTLDAW